MKTELSNKKKIKKSFLRWPCTFLFFGVDLATLREPHFQWNIGGIGSSGVGHVYFMYISCCLCIIFRVGYAKISRRKGRFQWNMGLKPIFHQNAKYLASGVLRYPTQNIPTFWYLWRWVTPIFRVFTRRKASGI